MLDHKEFDKRCHEVFISERGEEYFGIELIENESSGRQRVSITMTEEDGIIFCYEPNMEERPQALAYIMGERNDFND